MTFELSSYRGLAIAIGVSIATQVIQSVATVSPGVGGWFWGVASLLLIAVGIATFLRFRLSQWVLDGASVLLGLAGGVWL